MHCIGPAHLRYSRDVSSSKQLSCDVCLGERQDLILFKPYFFEPDPTTLWCTLSPILCMVYIRLVLCNILLIGGLFKYGFLQYIAGIVHSWGNKGLEYGGPTGDVGRTQIRSRCMGRMSCSSPCPQSHRMASEGTPAVEWRRNSCTCRGKFRIRLERSAPREVNTIHIMHSK